MASRIVLRGLNGVFKDRCWQSSDLLRVGRLEESEVVLDDCSVSRSHAQIRWTERGWRLRDLGSTHGTRLNGVRIGDGRWPLRIRDVLQFGAVAFLVESIIDPNAVQRAETWEACGHPSSLMESLGHVDWTEPVLDRKLRLWAVACLRREAGRHQGGLTHEQCAALSFLEEVVCDFGDFDRRREAMFRSVQGTVGPHGLQRSVLILLTDNASFREYCIASAINHVPEGRDERLTANGDLLRCALGNPWRPPAIDPSWLATNDGAVIALARSIERNGAFEDMPVLADALEDAGCSYGRLLGHLRGGVHCRSCHALDALLGRPTLPGFTFSE